MKPVVIIVDYGIGNIYIVCRAFEKCGAEILVTSDPEKFAGARHLVLPGVGAFGSGMAGLRERNLVKPICEHAAAGKPLMGICLGMQMLATVSEEFGEHRGLDIISGRVRRLPVTTTSGDSQKIPHIGWTQLFKSDRAEWQRTPLAGVQDGDSIYLVHSYAMQPDDAEHQIAFSLFGGHRICTVVRQGLVIGCQFHPEKSGPVGLNIISNFLII
jgi:glutamine amidotransferase